MNGEVKGLCIECEFYNPTEVNNCYIENSFQIFCINHKIEAIVQNCKGFKEKEPIIIEEEAQAEEQILIQTEAEAEKEMTKQADEAEVQQEVKDKGGVL